MTSRTRRKVLSIRITLQLRPKVQLQSLLAEPSKTMWISSARKKTMSDTLLCVRELKSKAFMVCLRRVIKRLISPPSLKRSPNIKAQYGQLSCRYAEKMPRNSVTITQKHGEIYSVVRRTSLQKQWEFLLATCDGMPPFIMKVTIPIFILSHTP